MELGEVIGTVVSTLKVPSWNGQRLLRVRPIDAFGAARGKALVALDVTSAARGQPVVFVRGRQVDRLEGPVTEARP